MEPALYARSLLAALLVAGCAGNLPAQKTSQGSEALSPELAALVAQPQTGSFNPQASKDAAFFKDTPERFRPFVAVCNAWDEWDKPAPPFKIHGNTWYVGTCGIAAILVVGADGHALFDSGTEAGADVVLDNIVKLGFDPKDIRILLASHEHFDHVGGMAKVQRATGARVISSEIGVAVMTSGMEHPGDPQAGMHEPMAPVAGGMPWSSDEGSALLDRFGIAPIPTPGHSPGAMSWSWQSCEGPSDEDCRAIVYADSLSPVSSDDYRFSDHPDYLAAYFDGLERLSYAECDILLAPHPSHSRMLRRMRRGELVEPASCAYYAIGKVQDLEARLAKEESGE